MRFSKRKILVTDDSMGFILYISVLLNKMGFNVIPAENGDEALKLINMRAPDLVILDVNMPVLDGISALKKLKADDRTKHIPAIMVSADPGHDKISECESLGSIAYLLKPINIDHLHEALQAALFAPVGQKRNHIRAEYGGRVKLTAGDHTEVLFARTISEGGIFLRKMNPLPVGTGVEVELKSDDNAALRLQGIVIYVNTMLGESFDMPPGMAIEFRDVSERDDEALSVFVKKILSK